MACSAVDESSAFDAGARRGGQCLMFYREAGVFKTSYAADMGLMPLPNTR